jgi:transposase-like protein
MPDRMSRPQGLPLSAEDRERAVNDLLEGMHVLGAAAVWGVLTADLQRWVKEAQAGARRDQDGRGDAAAG